MKKTAIIIPSRLDAQRLPNKPLELINNKEMILHVYEAALKSDAEEVFVATPDQRIKDIVKKFGGNCILTTGKHETGTDRVFEVFKKNLNSNPDIIINLQGDMPNILPETINQLVDYMNKGKCEIGTLASKLSSDSELEDENIVKVMVKEKLKKGMFVKALDFVRRNNTGDFQVYHHVGIYAFTNKALLRYVGLKRSKLEIERKLEQLRALEAGLEIKVLISKEKPIGIDTKDDLKKFQNLLKSNINN